MLDVLRADEARAEEHAAVAAERWVEARALTRRVPDAVALHLEDALVELRRTKRRRERAERKAAKHGE